MKQVYRADDVKTPSQKFKHELSIICMQSRPPFVAKKRKEKEKMKKERERKGNRKMQGLHTGDQVKNHFRHAWSVRGFKLSSKSFPGKVWIAHA